MATVTSVAVPRLRLLPYKSYSRPNHQEDPVRYYYWPLLGRVYRQRVETCLAECRGGQRVLEIGFGSGVTFLNLHESYDEIHGIDLTCDAADVTRAFRERGIETYLSNGDVLDLSAYPEGHFDTVLLISILEHLKPNDLDRAFLELRRVLKPGGQVVYGVPVERRLMVLMFRVLGRDIRAHHFSTEKNVRDAAARRFQQVRVRPMKTWVPFAGAVYEVGHFVKAGG
jgi:ubiquinone/menaquinone biosynthesis C-methylase UbiE